MKIKNFVLWLLSWATLGASAAHAQTVTLAGSCSGFTCDHATVIQDGSQTTIQLTDGSEFYTHMLSFSGTQDGDVIHVTQIVRDGEPAGNAGECTLQLPTQIVCKPGQGLATAAYIFQIIFTGSK